MTNVVTTIGSNLLMSSISNGMILQAVKESTSAISFIVKKAYEKRDHYPPASEVYEQIDLLADMRVIGAISDDLLKVDKGKSSKAISVAVDNIRETLQTLHQKMAKIDKLIQEHSNKYLSGWRTFDQSIQLEEIKSIHQRLLYRLDILSKVMTILK